MEAVYPTLIDIALEYAELAGATNTKLDDRQLKMLIKTADAIWSRVNTQRAFKMFTKIQNALVEANRTEFSAQLIQHLKTNHQDFQSRISQDAAGQLLQGFRESSIAK